MQKRADPADATYQTILQTCLTRTYIHTVLEVRCQFSDTQTIFLYVAIPAYSYLSSFESAQGTTNQSQRLISHLWNSHNNEKKPYKYYSVADAVSKQILSLWYLNALVLIHTGGVIHCQEHLVLSLTWFWPPQPYPVILEVAGNVWNNSSHVQSFTRPEITSKYRV